MKKISVLFFITFLYLSAGAQLNCEGLLGSDTLTFPGENKLLTGKSAGVSLKNNGSVKIFIADNRRLFMRLEITENFYFNKVDMLEIKSGSKSYYAKNTRQYKLDRSRGLYTIEIYSNYVTTLKELGITGLVFGGAETDFKKQDAAQVKELARCVHEAIAVNR